MARFALLLTLAACSAPAAAPDAGCAEAARCEGGALVRCGEQASDCAPTYRCASGACLPAICAPGQGACAVPDGGPGAPARTSRVRLTCDPFGAAWQASSCPGEEVCGDGAGGDVDCVPP